MYKYIVGRVAEEVKEDAWPDKYSIKLWLGLNKQ